MAAAGGPASADEPECGRASSCRQGRALPAGNWINGKLRGVVEGVDYQRTGQVRSLNTTSIKSQLASGNIVVLTSLAYSLAGVQFPRTPFSLPLQAPAGALPTPACELLQ